MTNHANHLKLILAAAAGLIVLAAFGVPVLPYLPLLALLAVCPLMMVFMMRSMDHGGSGQGLADRDGKDTPTAHRH